MAAFGEAYVVDPLGNVQAGVAVDLIDPATGVRIADTVYRDAGLTQVATLPLATDSSGHAPFWLAAGKTVIGRVALGGTLYDDYINVVDPTAPVSGGGSIPTHTHVEGDVNSLTTDLAAKAALIHTHTEAQVTSLTTDLTGKAASVHSHIESDVGNLPADLLATEKTVNKNVANGYAGLDNSNLILTARMGGGTADSGRLLRGDRTWIRQTGPTYYNVESYGATRNTDMSTVWTSILTDLNTVPGIVYFPGTASTDAWNIPALVLPNRCGIQGAGKRATRLFLLNGQNTHAISNHQSTGSTDPYARFLTLRDFWLDGNSANQTGTCHGINISNPAPGSDTATRDDDDNHTLVNNVWIYNAKTNGFVNAGGSEVRLQNVVAQTCGQHGFAPNYDSWLSDCTAEKNGQNGFHIAFGSIGLSNCKAFYNGSATVSNTQGNGLYIVSAGSTGGVNVSNFRAQDNGANGVAIFGGAGETGRWNHIHGLLCDSNGWGRVGALATPGTYVGLMIWDTQYTVINGYSSFDRIVDHGAGARVTQRNALSLNASGAGIGHHIYVRDGFHGGMVASQDASMAAAIGTYNTTNVVNSSVTFNGTTTTS